MSGAVSAIVAGSVLEAAVGTTIASGLVGAGLGAAGGAALSAATGGNPLQGAEFGAIGGGVGGAVGGAFAGDAADAGGAAGEAGAAGGEGAADTAVAGEAATTGGETAATSAANTQAFLAPGESAASEGVSYGGGAVQTLGSTGQEITSAGTDIAAVAEKAAPAAADQGTQSLLKQLTGGAQLASAGIGIGTSVNNLVGGGGGAPNLPAPTATPLASTATYNSAAQQAAQEDEANARKGELANLLTPSGTGAQLARSNTSLKQLLGA